MGTTIGARIGIEAGRQAKLAAHNSLLAKVDALAKSTDAGPIESYVPSTSSQVDSHHQAYDALYRRSLAYGSQGYHRATPNQMSTALKSLLR